MSPDLWMLLSFLALLVLGVPVAFALGLSGAIGILAGLTPDMLATLGTNTFNGVAKYPLIAIPLFILTGLVFEKSGVALRLVRFAELTDAQRQAFSDATASVRDQWTPKIGEDLVEAARQAIAQP